MYLCVEDISFTSFYVFVCWRYQFDLFLCICVLRISVLPLSMYLCVEDTGFSHISVPSFYLHVFFLIFFSSWVKLKYYLINIKQQLINHYGYRFLSVYRFYLFLCICVLKISVLPLSMYLCVEDIGFTSFYVFVCWHKYITFTVLAWYRHSSKNKVVGFWLILQHSSRFPR
jgi:hypothetical protein